MNCVVCVQRPTGAVGQTGATASATRRRLDHESVSQSLAVDRKQKVARALARKLIYKVRVVITKIDLQGACCDN